MTFGHIDCNVVAHCNNSCAACSHAAPVNDPYVMDPAILERDLANAKRAMVCQNLQIVGGEPTLHPAITDILRVAKASKVGKCVLLITNGRRLSEMPEEFWSECQAVSISIYPGFDHELLSLARRKSHQYQFGLFHNRYDDFFLQLKKVTDSGEHTFKNCHWKNDCFTIHEGRFYRCPQSIFFPGPILQKESRSDGLLLDGITEASLQEYLSQDAPMVACSVCTGGMRSTRQWRQVKREDWIQESTE